MRTILVAQMSLLLSGCSVQAVTVLERVDGGSLDAAGPSFDAGFDASRPLDAGQRDAAPPPDGEPPDGGICTEPTEVFEASWTSAPRAPLLEASPQEFALLRQAYLTDPARSGLALDRYPLSGGTSRAILHEHDSLVVPFALVLDNFDIGAAGLQGHNQIAFAPHIQRGDPPVTFIETAEDSIIDAATLAPDRVYFTSLSLATGERTLHVHDVPEGFSAEHPIMGDLPPGEIFFDHPRLIYDAGQLWFAHINVATGQVVLVPLQPDGTPGPPISPLEGLPCSAASYDIDIMDGRVALVVDCVNPELTVLTVFTPGFAAEIWDLLPSRVRVPSRVAGDGNNLIGVMSWPMDEQDPSFVLFDPRGRLISHQSVRAPRPDLAIIAMDLALSPMPLEWAAAFTYSDTTYFARFDVCR